MLHMKNEIKKNVVFSIFRQTQWDPPTWDGVAPDDAMDLESPLYEEIVKVKRHHWAFSQLLTDNC